MSSSGGHTETIVYHDDGEEVVEEVVEEKVVEEVVVEDQPAMMQPGYGQ